MLNILKSTTTATVYVPNTKSKDSSGPGSHKKLTAQDPSTKPPPQNLALNTEDQTP